MITICLQVEVLATLSAHDINTMTYIPSTKENNAFTLNPQVIDLPKGSKNDIRIFQRYITYRNGIGKPIDNWLSITQHDINRYIVSND